MPTSHSRVFELLLPGYILGCLDQDDLITVSEHVTHCAECQAELQAYQAIADQLALIGPVVSPSSKLKNRLMDRIQPTQPQDVPLAQPTPNFMQRTLLVWATVALLIILGLSASSWLLWQRVNQLEAMLEQRANTMQSVTLTSATGAAPDATGVIVLSLNGWQGTLVVDHLPELDEQHQYQLWLIRNGSRDSGAVFSVDDYGYSAVWISSSQPIASYSSFGISIEPVGGSASPTGEQVLGGNLN